MRAHARLMLMDQIEKTVLQIPGQTATEIARSLFGLDGYQERVQPSLRSSGESRPH